MNRVILIELCEEILDKLVYIINKLGGNKVIDSKEKLCKHFNEFPEFTVSPDIYAFIMSKVDVGEYELAGCVAFSINEKIGPSFADIVRELQA